MLLVSVSNVNANVPQFVSRHFFIFDALLRNHLVLHCTAQSVAFVCLGVSPSESAACIWSNVNRMAWSLAWSFIVRSNQFMSTICTSDSDLIHTVGLDFIWISYEWFLGRNHHLCRYSDYHLVNKSIFQGSGIPYIMIEHRNHTTISPDRSRSSGQQKQILFFRVLASDFRTGSCCQVEFVLTVLRQGNDACLLFSCATTQQPPG